ncbi:cvnh domain-containing protein [Colletotrichum truncatum]|uniref:Cvnh domain-containing protein n=1 Tax=Colletotrichum truncatum TaxID=5467 RepID=A0ACC3YYV2_COLTU|nr:cvnh domain-containing protein [Colletotrichum truncatum]KAF6781743.1 cvnh domain-containing protein [Colletotrichum truncatum]
MIGISSTTALKGLFLALGVTKVAQAGFLDEGCGYLNDGNQFTLRGDGTVTTYCDDKICGASSFSAINLNDCIANVLGDLKIKPEHHTGSETCKDCIVDGYDIKCQCKTLADTYKETSINVNEVLTNWNGYLSCLGGISDCYTVKWMCKPTDWWPEGNPPQVFTTDCDIWS